VLEIGPGLGHLTRVLAQRAGHVVAIEIDPDLAGKLRRDLGQESRVQVIQGDILERNAAEWLEQAGAGFDPARRFKVVANLPYYITTAILRHLLTATHKPRTLVVMVQREVAQRMVARPPDMSLLAVSVQFFATVRIVRTIAPGAFYPRPKVESAVVRLDVDEVPRLGEADAGRFFELVRAGFGERRKQLRNSMASGLEMEPLGVAQMLGTAGIDPTRRAETLSLAEWEALYVKWSRIPIARGRDKV
jgi:16S rRNA (adenine1518-N6/adenine1519-N6)-dimethyltransferase